jgi:hypothetical protein
LSAVLKYRYTPNVPRVLAGLFGAAVLSGLAVYRALHSAGGIDFGGMSLTAEQAGFFFWGLAGLCSFFTFVGLGAFLIAIRHEHYIELTNTAFSAPQYIHSAEPTVIPLAEITSVEIYRHRGQSHMAVRHLGGLLNIAGNMLPEAGALDTLYTTLSALATPPEKR